LYYEKVKSALKCPGHSAPIDSIATIVSAFACHISTTHQTLKNMKNTQHIKHSLFLALALLSGWAQADNLIANGSFEGDSATPLINNRGDANSMALTTGSNYLPGWTVTGPEIAWIGSGNPYALSASHGDRFIDLTGWSNSNATPGGVVQTINTVAGGHYTLDFDMGNSVNYNYGSTVALTASAGNTSQVFTNTDTTGTNSWQHFTLNFTASGNTTDVSFTGKSAIFYIGVDNVAVTAAVPEPETWGMLLAGLGLVGVIARRRKTA
jgi:hypothetical protein